MKNVSRILSLLGSSSSRRCYCVKNSPRSNLVSKFEASLRACSERMSTIFGNIQLNVQNKWNFNRGLINLTKTLGVMG